MLSDRFNSTAEGIDLLRVADSDLALVLCREKVFFAEVTKPGRLKTGDTIEVLGAND